MYINLFLELFVEETELRIARCTSTNTLLLLILVPNGIDTSQLSTDVIPESLSLAKNGLPMGMVVIELAGTV